jgi:hypothetical protein
MAINHPHSSIKFSGMASIDLSFSIRQRSNGEYELEVGGEGYRIPPSIILALEKEFSYPNASEQDRIKLIIDKILKFSSESE